MFSTIRLHNLVSCPSLAFFSTPVACGQCIFTDYSTEMFGTYSLIYMLSGLCPIGYGCLLVPGNKHSYVSAAQIKIKDVRIFRNRSRTFNWNCSSVAFIYIYIQLILTLVESCRIWLYETHRLAGKFFSVVVLIVWSVCPPLLQPSPWESKFKLLIRSLIVVAAWRR